MNFGNQEKMKAITFSYDDGVTQDIRLIELLNKYDLKCTFNLNSQLLGTGKVVMRRGKRISHYKLCTARGMSAPLRRIQNPRENRQ